MVIFHSYVSLPEGIVHLILEEISQFRPLALHLRCGYGRVLVQPSGENQRPTLVTACSLHERLIVCAGGLQNMLVSPTGS